MKKSPSEVSSKSSSTLFFGDTDAICHADSRIFAERMNQLAPGVKAYDPIGGVRDFRSKFNGLQLPALSLAAASISPTTIERVETQNATLMFPLAGNFNIHLEGVQHHCGDRQGSMFYPQGSGHFEGSGSHRNLAVIQFDPQRLESTARAMLGLPGTALMDLNLQNPRVAPLTVAGQPFSAVLQQVGTLIDLYQRDAGILTTLGVPDLIYRHLVMLLRPEYFFHQAWHPRTSNDSTTLVAQLCEYMQANLEMGLTLTDLEVFSGLSARSLQLAFKKQFGCSPMQWLTMQKLHKVRHKLLNDRSAESIASLAVGYFPNLGDFARYYHRQFGELPSQTRARQTR